VLKKVFYILVLILSGISTAKSQPFGNEWINYDQKYFAIKIHENGLYRLSYDVLQSAGVPVGSFDPRSFQIFFRGIEQPIMVRNESSGLFSPGDYILFYAERNDGYLDQELYRGRINHPNPDFSLFTDTTTYYLTWNNHLNNRRFIPETDVDFAGFTPADFFWHTERANLTSHFYRGEPDVFGATDPLYTPSEGWFGTPLTLGRSISHTMPAANPFTGGPDARVEIAIAGASNFAAVNPDHHLRITFAGQTIDTLFEGHSLIRIFRQLPAAALIPSGTPFVFSSLNTLGSSVSRSAVAFIEVTYPHTWNLRNLGQLKITLPPGGESRTLVSFNNFNAAVSDTVWIFDLENNRQIPVVRTGEQFRALIPFANQERTLFLTSSGRIRNVTRVQPVNSDPARFARFRNFAAPSFADPTFLLVTHRSLWNEATQYMVYRNTTGQRVLMVDVEELYHQFAFGTFKHPLAIRNFVRYVMHRNPVSPPQYLFLLGKAIDARNNRRNLANFAANLVPSFGDPGSDILITAGIDGADFVPALATGRLAARNPAHVSLYLNKVKEYEAAQRTPQEWMKRVLHFGGGSSLLEQAFLASYLGVYERQLEGPKVGANVKTFLKSSTEPVQIDKADSIRQIIDTGVSLMTFFGHASGVGFDLSIDHPSEYNNVGKYPFVIANSCFSGDIFSTATSTSEDFVLIENRGAIGYLGSTSLSASFDLHLYSREFFSHLSGAMYGESFGRIKRETIRNLHMPGDPLRMVILNTALHADPAIRMNSFPKPDYQVLLSDVSFLPKIVSAELDSFTVRINALNLGMATYDSIMVELTRTFADGSSQRSLKRVEAPFYRTEIDFRLPLDRVKGIGVNRFEVLVDAFNDMEELNEGNNTATSTLLIKTAELQPVLPHRYAIIPDAQVTLIASAGNPFDPPRTYVFEIDTSGSFASPFRHTTTQSGGRITWSPPFALIDSTVYFWRVSPSPAIPGEYNWRSSSFQYIPGRRGWSQAHFDQFEQNRYRFINYRKNERDWIFQNNLVSVSAQTGFFPFMAFSKNWLRVDGILTRLFSCLGSGGHGMVFFVFDPISGELWESTLSGVGLGQFNNVHCLDRNFPGFDFFTHTEEWRERVRIFLYSIPAGHYVLAWSHRNHHAPSFSEGLLQGFESLGSSRIRTLPANTPYLIWGRKGQPPGTASEIVGENTASIIQLNEQFLTNWDRGYMKTLPIGPARGWSSLHWLQESVEQPSADSVSLDVFGLRPGGEPVLLIEGIPSSQRDVLDLNNQINAAEYPLLLIRANMQDEIHRTPSQMRRWQVLYEGIPEATLDPALHFVMEADTLKEGQDLIFSTAITNISAYDMDSLLVRYWMIDKNNRQVNIPYPRKGPLRAGQSLIDTVRFNTLGYAGNNTIFVEINPDHDQLEQYHFNNIGSLPFYVVRDRSNPLLDVTFDGLRIMDGEVVSAEPLIRITLNDENRFLLLNDTSLVRVLVHYPGEREPRRMFFREGGREQMRFFPANQAKNTCIVEFQPRLTQDGRYRLKVQATDRSLNNSGAEDYVINFEVINKSTITEVLNWPNPFSTATHFVFTLTGSELPTYFKIQIMTITGRVVREIDMSELGPLRIGRNITQFAWDGTDQHGARLANGVYLYRIITNIDGQNIELNPTGASRFFHRQMGKMYLIR